jgi:hypothetical protein
LYSVKVITFQLDNICEAIENLRDSCDDSANVSDCESVLQETTTIEFVLSLIIWYDVLSRVDSTVTHLRQFSAWLEQYNSTGFETALKEAHEFAGNSKYNIPSTFKEKGTIRRKRMYDYYNVFNYRCQQIITTLYFMVALGLLAESKIGSFGGG